MARKLPRRDAVIVGLGWTGSILAQSSPIVTAKILPEDMTVQDWGVTYDDLEPHYDQFEYLCGTSGTAGNINGKIQEGGNPFEGPRSRPYPTPAMKQGYGHALFAEAARQIGYKPYPQPSGNLSQSYTTNFEARTECEVMRINLDRTSKWASANGSAAPIIPRLRRRRPSCRCCCASPTGVTYVDASGTQWEQPADLMLLCAFQLFNVQLLSLSGIGTPYDPQTGKGQIGRNYTHQTVSTAVGFFDKDKYNFNPFIASGSIGVCIDEFNGDNFDHSQLGFV